MSNKFIVVPDDESESFSRSPCECSFCLDMHIQNSNWSNYTPTTAVQRNMMRVIERLEDKPQVSLRRSDRLAKRWN